MLTRLAFLSTLTAPLFAAVTKFKSRGKIELTPTDTPESKYPINRELWRNRRGDIVVVDAGRTRNEEGEIVSTYHTSTKNDSGEYSTYVVVKNNKCVYVDYLFGHSLNDPQFDLVERLACAVWLAD